MSSPIIHVQIFPTFPAEPELRQLHSTRKLEAILGATPLILDLNSKVPKPPISPRTRATRRTGRIFHSPSSSVSSTESDVFVDTDVRSGSYYPQLHSPASSTRSSSPTSSVIKLEPVTEKHARSGKSREIGDGTMSKSQGPQTIAQPFLLQLRSVAVPFPTASSIKSEVSPVGHSKPLSPISSSFNMDTTTNITTTSLRTRHLTDSQKLKKLAKLKRTLGENVPPELVFHHSLPPLQRSISLSTSQPWKYSSHKPSRSITPIAETPAPQPQLSYGATLKRPRSMTLTTTTTMTQSVGTETRATTPFGDYATAPAYHVIDHPFDSTIPFADAEDTKRIYGDTLSPEWGKRREREWSGEWNIRDMDYVTKALRGLKSR